LFSLSHTKAGAIDIANRLVTSALAQQKSKVIIAPLSTLHHAVSRFRVLLTCFVLANPRLVEVHSKVQDHNRKVPTAVQIVTASVRHGQVRENAQGIRNTCLPIANGLAMLALAVPVFRRARRHPSAVMAINNVLIGHVLANVREILDTWT